jgi:hypothetical protein
MGDPGRRGRAAALWVIVAFGEAVVWLIAAMRSSQGYQGKTCQATIVAGTAA